MPTYAAMIYNADVDWTLPEYGDVTKEYMAFGEAAAAVIRGGAALYPTSTATSVQVKGGKGGDVVTTDGPYAETKEALTGFYLIETDDLDGAIQIAAQIPGVWDGTVEVRPVIQLTGGSIDAESALVRLVRDEGRIVLATLVRKLGSLDLAEDAVQEAVLRALETWPQRGLPDSPRAWLTTTARNWAIDRIRREGARGPKEEEALRVAGISDDAVPPDSVVRDDLLRLVFTCCHPALSLDAQVALSLRTLCGLSTAEVARALLVSEATMTKRLTRARNKIRVAGIPYRIPADHELPADSPP